MVFVEPYRYEGDETDRHEIKVFSTRALAQAWIDNYPHRSGLRDVFIENVTIDDNNFYGYQIYTKSNY
jgi:hypothetical protein